MTDSTDFAYEYNLKAGIKQRCYAASDRVMGQWPEAMEAARRTIDQFVDQLSLEDAEKLMKTITDDEKSA